MSDSTSSAPDFAAKAKAGLFKGGAAAIYMDICQHFTPPLAGYLNMHYPIIGDTLSFEIVTFAQSLLAVAVVRFTPQHFVDWVKDCILYWRGALKTWGDALRGNVSETPK